MPMQRDMRGFSSRVLLLGDATAFHGKDDDSRLLLVRRRPDRVGEQSEFGKQDTQCDHIRIVDPEDRDRGSADRCSSAQIACTTCGPLEMEGPIVEPRMKEPSGLAGFRIGPFDCRPLVRIAMWTGEGKIIELARSSAISRDDVVNRESGNLTSSR